MALPRSGRGAVAATSREPRKTRTRPAVTVASSGRSRRRKGSSSSQGASSTTQSGAVDCRKIAAAAVVSLVAVTKQTSVAA